MAKTREAQDARYSSLVFALAGLGLVAVLLFAQAAEIRARLDEG